MEIIPNFLVIPIGVVIGVLVAAPVGPVNVLCIQRSIERGALGGIAAGLGAVLGDGLLALAAALGIGAVSGAIREHRAIIQVVGGIAMLAFGLKLYFTPPGLQIQKTDGKRDVRLIDFVWDIPQTFFLTITNPGALLGIVALIGAASTFVALDRTIDALVLVAAIVGGSLAWWVGLSHLIGRVRHHLDPKYLLQINRAAGLVLLVFGAAMLFELAWGY